MTADELLEKMAFHLGNVKLCAQELRKQGYIVTTSTYTKTGTPLILIEGGENTKPAILVTGNPSAPPPLPPAGGPVLA